MFHDEMIRKQVTSSNNHYTNNSPIEHKLQVAREEPYMLAGDAELLEPQRAGLEEPLEVAAHSLFQLGCVCLHPLPDAIQELYHADLGCASQGSNFGHEKEAALDL